MNSLSQLNALNFTIINQDALDDGSNSIYGSSPENRSVNELLEYGMINLDKHAGPTSHEIVAIIKKILNIKKAGHSGTLDPNVTGVLPIGLNESTKILNSLLLAPKQYVGILRCISDLPLTLWEDVAYHFSGLIYQVPPLKSNVVKKLRKRNIYNLDIIESKENEVLFRVECQAGTYIRTLCIDMGKSIGYSSYMKELRRIKSGPFEEKSANTLTEVFDAFENYKDGSDLNTIKQIIFPIEEGISHLPKLILRDNAIDPICHGSIINLPGIIAYQEFSKNQLLALLSAKGELVGLGLSLRDNDNLEKNSSGSIAKPTRIIMKRGTYPRYIKT